MYKYSHGSQVMDHQVMGQYIYCMYVHTHVAVYIYMYICIFVYMYIYTWVSSDEARVLGHQVMGHVFLPV